MPFACAIAVPTEALLNDPSFDVKDVKAFIKTLEANNISLIGPTQ
jgi:hypothetical protein